MVFLSLLNIFNITTCVVLLGDSYNLIDIGSKYSLIICVTMGFECIIVIPMSPRKTCDQLQLHSVVAHRTYIFNVSGHNNWISLSAKTHV